MKAAKRIAGAVRRLGEVVPYLLRLVLVVGALGAIGYGCEGIRPGLGYLAVGVLLWWELRTAHRRTGGEES